jgi:preprotein translocase subunit SecG
MATAIIILHILVSILIIIMVLLQTGKGAAIGSTFGGGGSQALFGSSGPTSLLTKITAACAIIFMMTSIYLTILSKQAGTKTIMSDTPAAIVPASETKADNATGSETNSMKAGETEKTGSAE